MIVRKSHAKTFDIPRCHGGEGILRCTEYLGEYEGKEAGIAFIHDNILPVGASIGEHTHAVDEELYHILEGEGTMAVDGVSSPICAGDVCITRSGHSHGLWNTGREPIRFLVVGTRRG